VIAPRLLVAARARAVASPGVAVLAAALRVSAFRIPEAVSTERQLALVVADTRTLVPSAVDRASPALVAVERFLAPTKNYTSQTIWTPAVFEAVLILQLAYSKPLASRFEAQLAREDLPKSNDI